MVQHCYIRVEEHSALCMLLSLHGQDVCVRDCLVSCCNRPTPLSGQGGLLSREQHVSWMEHTCPLNRALNYSPVVEYKGCAHICTHQGSSPAETHGNHVPVLFPQLEHRSLFYPSRRTWLLSVAQRTNGGVGCRSAVDTTYGLPVPGLQSHPWSLKPRTLRQHIAGVVRLVPLDGMSTCGK